MATQYTFTDDNGIWKDTRSISSSGNHTYRIKTNSTFVNKNIELTVNVPAASPRDIGHNDHIDEDKAAEHRCEASDRGSHLRPECGGGNGCCFGCRKLRCAS